VACFRDVSSHLSSRSPDPARLDLRPTDPTSPTPDPATVAGLDQKSNILCGGERGDGRMGRTEHGGDAWGGRGQHEGSSPAARGMERRGVESERVEPSPVEQSGKGEE
jgi:hypothetical protein